MKPKNKPQIRSASINFGLLFVALVCFTIVPAYFFVWTSNQQKEAFLERVQKYRQVQNKQMLLKEKMDSLYIQLNYVNADKVTDYLPLEKGIAENRHDVTAFIGADSSGDFRAYAHILNSLNNQLLLKDSIVKMVGIENMLKTDLISCISKTKGVHRSIFSQTQLSGN